MENHSNTSDVVFEKTSVDDENKEFDIRTYLTRQQTTLEAIVRQQGEMLNKMSSRKDSEKTPKRRKKDDEVSLEASGDEYQSNMENMETEEASHSHHNDDADPLAQYCSKGHNGKGVDGDDDGVKNIEDEDDTATARYKDLLDSTVEDMGPPIEGDLAIVCGKI